jgi:putative transposase
MNDQRTATVRKTFKEKLRLTSAQEQVFDEVLWRCRELYNAGLEERKTAWERRHVSLTQYDQQAELGTTQPDLPSKRTINA